MWPWRRPEVRSSNFTEQVLASLMSSASGGHGATAISAVEVAAGWWSRALSSARVLPEHATLNGLGPATLAAIGRGLCIQGETVHLLDVVNGQVELLPVGHWEVQGGPRPPWSYTVTLSGPTHSERLKVSSDQVLHCRLAPSATAPWRGRSPLSRAMATASAAGRLETALENELGFQSSQLLVPRRNASSFEQEVTLDPDTRQAIVSSMATQLRQATLILPEDLAVQRLGASPPPVFSDLRDRFEASIVSLCGVPAALIDARAPGTASKEAFRQFLHATVQPLGELVLEEIRAKLHPEATISFDSLRSADVQSRARSAASLVAAGYSHESAAAVVGLDGVEVREVPA